jgi:hypothetical protein
MHLSRDEMTASPNEKRVCHISNRNFIELSYYVSGHKADFRAWHHGDALEHSTERKKRIPYGKSSRILAVLAPKNASG